MILGMLRKVFRVFVIAAVAWALATGFAAAALAQQPTTAPSAAAPGRGLAGAATLVASALAKMKAKRVALFDFVNADTSSWDRVGQQLAAYFRVQIDTAPHKFKQADYKDVAAWVKRGLLAQGDLLIADVAAYTLTGEGVDAFVVGSLIPNATATSIDVRLYVQNAKKAARRYKSR
jgi:hypothetical protein